MRNLFLFCGVFLVLLIGTGCRTVSIPPQSRLVNLLPELTPLIDEASFIRGGYASAVTTGTSTAFAFGSPLGVHGIGSHASATFSNPMLAMYAQVFQSDVERNISTINVTGNPYGFIVLSLVGSRRDHAGFGWTILSGLTAFIPNLFGMPAGAVEHVMQIEVSIYNRSGNRIGRYRSDIHRKRNYLAMWWGYGPRWGDGPHVVGSASIQSRLEAFTAGMEDIKRQIAWDRNRLVRELQ